MVQMLGAELQCSPGWISFGLRHERHLAAIGAQVKTRQCDRVLEAIQRGTAWHLLPCRLLIKGLHHIHGRHESSKREWLQSVALGPRYSYYIAHQ